MSNLSFINITLDNVISCIPFFYAQERAVFHLGNPNENNVHHSEMVLFEMSLKSANFVLMTFIEAIYKDKSILSNVNEMEIKVLYDKIKFLKMLTQDDQQREVIEQILGLTQKIENIIAIFRKRRK